MWGGGKNTFNSSRQGGGGSGAGGGGGVSSSWVDDNYVSKDYFNQLFKVKVAVRVLVTDPSTTPATVISDTSTVRQDLLYPNEVPASTTTTDEETGYVTSTTYSIDSIQVMGGVWTNSYVSALGQNSSGGGGGGGSLNEPLLSINMAGLSAPGAAQDGMTIVWDQATGRWKYGSAGAGSVTSVGMTVPTGFSVSPATITSTGTFAITFASGYSLPTTAKQLNWDKAYGWGNHATAGYALTSNVYSKTECDERFLTIAFFRSLFRAYTSGNTEVTPNAGDTSTIDNIKGILYIKDLLPHLGKGDNFRWQTLIRPAFFVPETKQIDDLLRDFQSSKVHIAIVVDEFGGTLGLVTLEDVIEEIVGEINDEYDEVERAYVKLNSNTYLFEAKTMLSDFQRELDLDDELFEEVEGDADSLAGLLLELKGDFPELHENIDFHHLTFEVMEMDERRIVKIKVVVHNTSKSDADA